MGKKVFKNCIIFTIFATLIFVRLKNERVPWIGTVTYFGLLVSVENIIWRLKISCIIKRNGKRDMIDYGYITVLTCGMVALLVLMFTYQIELTPKAMDIMTLLTLIFTILDDELIIVLRWIIAGGVTWIKNLLEIIKRKRNYCCGDVYENAEREKCLFNNEYFFNRLFLLLFETGSFCCIFFPIYCIGEKSCKTIHGV